MSTVFRVRCDLHEVDGPQVHRAAGGTSLNASPDSNRLAADEWSEFLIEHEWCGGLRLVHE